MVGIKGGVEITTVADLPAGIGLASSSSHAKVVHRSAERERGRPPIPKTLSELRLGKPGERCRAFVRFQIPPRWRSCPRAHLIYTLVMRCLRIATNLVIVVTAAATVLLAQTRMKPTAPGTTGDPAWQAVVGLSDGRTLVTDGGIAIEAALAKLARLPEKEFSGKVIENYFNLPLNDEYRFGDLTPSANGRTYTTPSGIPLNATYLDYLRRILPAGSVRFRMGGELQPVVILVDGKAVGALMPVRK
jgi:hypothetical protein